MALTRPTLSALYARVQADFVALSDTGGAILRRSAEWVMARITARTAHGLYAYIEDQRKQSFPDTAGIEGVRQWGALFGVDEISATAAEGPVTFTGTNTTAVPAGTEVAFDGVFFTTNSEVTISGGTATATVTASEAGADGNVAEAATGTLTSPIVGIDTTVTAGTGGIIGGADDETVESYRARVLARMASPPRGGTTADYEAWISETPGVTVFNSWVYPLGDGVGTVAATFTVVDSTEAEGFVVPSGAQVTAVQDYVDSKRPVDMRSFRAYAPGSAALTLSVTLTIESGADLATVKAAAEAALSAMLGSDAEPGVVIPLSRISEAISTTAGEASHVITSPLSDPDPGTGNIFDSVAVTWS